MKSIVIEVVATGAEAKAIRKSRSEWDDVAAAHGNTFWVLRADGRLQIAHFQLDLAESIPPGSIVRLTSVEGSKASQAHADAALSNS